LAEGKSAMTGADSVKLLEDGAARHLVAGLPLPDLGLASTQGGAVNLRAWPGRAVVYVYPWTGRPGLADPPGWDDIPGAHGSTPETAGFRDRHAEFQALGVAVFGLSTQSSEHQRELAARLGVPFALLSDAQFAFQAALALPTFKAGGTRYLKRLTLLVRDGCVDHVFYPVHPPEAHALEVLGWLSGSGW
jgi:peroxiredoxin